MSVAVEPASKARLRLWLKLLKASRRVEGEVREHLRAEHGATLPRFDVMAMLHRYRDGLRMSELAGVLRVSNGNVTGIVDRLVAEGLIERAPVAGDRRAMRVRLTSAGAAQFERLAKAHEALIDRLLGEVSPAEAAALTESLSQIADRGDRA